ncbi:MAG: DUF4332 domain-containing protein [Hyphomicrobiaceae bacterium]|nr:DUF4332 domain-containing protein [Hyphomicrobiaceae bacterium]
MSLAFVLIRAAHASGTHHKLALDALDHLASDNAVAWKRLFYGNAKLYLEGAKAPDTEFKDFKNHVLHPGDGYWGGAPEKARNWYGHLLTALRESNWSEAAWCAGVLSHYVTDPAMPFHTAQSEAETAIHRAAEWSINRSYDSLVREARTSGVASVPEPGREARWLEAYLCTIADAAHAHYEKLIAHYDITAGVREPEAGLDAVGRQIVAGQLAFAAQAFARVLDRALLEAGVAPAAVSLRADAVLATLEMPLKWMLARIADAEERRVIEAMYDELVATGRVEKTLPEDDRAVRDLHAREVLAPRLAARQSARAQRIGGPARTSAMPHPTAKLPSAPGDTLSQLSSASERPMPAPSLGLDMPWPAARTEVPSPSTARLHLTGTDAVVKAPSIGAKTAGRLAAVGVTTVADLMSADAATLADRLADDRIAAATIARWQDEAALVLTIPGLRGTSAQLLVGSGYPDVEALASADPAVLCARLLRFSLTGEGSRILRDGAAPDIEQVKTWVEVAQAVRKAA